jgi:reactive intermediate/imine deaminase
MKKKPIFLSDPNKWKGTYSPAIEVQGGRFLFISGQVAIDDNGNVVGKGDIVAQTRKIFENIGRILENAGGDFSNIIKTNYYITDVSLFPKVAALRSEYFKNEYPASTMVGVNSLVNEDLLLEVEVVAVLK